MPKPTLNDILIKPFVQEDQATVKELILQGLGEHFGFIDQTKNPDLDDIKSHYSNGHCLTAWLNNELVGTGALIHESEGTARIVRVSTRSDLRRQGLAGQLVTELINIARDNHYNEVVCETTAEWQEVTAFWKKQGFVFEGITEGDANFRFSLIKSP